MKFTYAISFFTILGTAAASSANTASTQEAHANKQSSPNKTRHSHVRELNQIAGTICGDTDDRVQSYDPRMGRLRADGTCTAWLISNDVFLTAGHCVDDSDILSNPDGFRVEFNVPNSNADGSTNPSASEDVYQVHFDSGNEGGLIPVEGVDWVHTIPGNDWAIGRLLPNEVTGLLPGAAQSCFFNLEFGDPLIFFNQEFGDPPIGTPTTVAGYGTIDDTVDDPLPRELNLVQTTHTGTLVSNSGFELKYETDTRTGTSGAPLVNTATDASFGIHNDGGCDSTGGSNAGTSVDNLILMSAIASYLGLDDAADQVKSGVCGAVPPSSKSGKSSKSSKSSKISSVSKMSSVGQGLEELRRIQGGIMDAQAEMDKIINNIEMLYQMDMMSCEGSESCCEEAKISAYASMSMSMVTNDFGSVMDRRRIKAV